MPTGIEITQLLQRIRELNSISDPRVRAVAARLNPVNEEVRQSLINAFAVGSQKRKAAIRAYSPKSEETASVD